MPATEDSMKTLPEVLPFSVSRSHMRRPAISPAVTLLVPMKPSTGGGDLVVGNDHLDPGFAGGINRRIQRGVRARRDDDSLHSARDRVLHELHLLIDVRLRRRPELSDIDAEVLAGFLATGQHRLPERRVVGADDHVDLLTRRRSAAAASATGAARRCGSSPDHPDDQGDEGDSQNQGQRKNCS